MTCFDIELMTNKKFDISRPTIIRHQTPYTLSISPSDSCSDNLISLYTLARKNGWMIGGIVLTAPQASMICDTINSTTDDVVLNADMFKKFLDQRQNYILCDRLEAKHISIQESACGIAQGDYLSLFLKQSALIGSSINSELVFCKDAAIDQSQLQIDYSFNIISEGFTSIIESDISCQSFLMLQSTLGLPSAIIRSGNIAVQNYSNLNYVNATGTNFDFRILSASDCIFNKCTLNLSSIEPDIPLDPSFCIQPMASSGTDIINDHYRHIVDLSTYQQNKCEAYAYDGDSFIEGCADGPIITNSPMQEAINDAVQALFRILNGKLPLTQSIKNSTINLDAYKNVLHVVSGQPLKFTEATPVSIGQIFTRCSFKYDTTINTSNTLMINNCSFFKCNNINAETILARNFAGFTTTPTPIEKFSSSETLGISSFPINSYIDQPSFDSFFEPGFTTLDTDSHVTTQKWYGEVSIGPNCSITCEDFYSAYCDIQPYGLLKLTSNEITFKNLGIQCLALDATIEVIGEATLYITRNYNHQIPNKLRTCNNKYNLLIPDLRGTISGTSFRIRQPNVWENMSSFFDAATISCESLNINIPMDFYKILNVKELEITKGEINIASLGEDPGQYMEGTIKITDCSLTIDNLVFPNVEVISQASDYYKISLESNNSRLSMYSEKGKHGAAIVGAVFNDSTLIKGALVSPSISGIVVNDDIIISPSVDNMSSYYGAPFSVIDDAIIPSGSKLVFTDNPDKKPPAMYNCTVAGVPDAKRIGTTVEARLGVKNSTITNIGGQKIIVLDRPDGNNNNNNIFSYGNVEMISAERPINPPDYGWKTDWNIGLIKVDFMNNIPKYGGPLQLSGRLPSDSDPNTQPIAYVRDIVIQSSRVDLPVGNNYFINLSLEGSTLDGKRGAFSNCSFIFNVKNSSLVKFLNINLYYSMTVDSSHFVGCTLNLEPLTQFLTELDNSFSSGPYNYYYYMNNTSLQSCNIKGTKGSHLIIKNCDLYEVTLSQKVYISGLEKIVLRNCVNNTAMRCETLIMIDCINNGTIDCKDLTWQNSQNNGNVTFENAVDVDGSF